MAAWRSGNVVGHISEVTLSTSDPVSTGMGDRLRRINYLSISPSQLSLLPSVGWEMSTSQSVVSDALPLESKGRYGSFHLWINVWVAVNTCYTWAIQRSSHYKALYQSTDTLLYFTLKGIAEQQKLTEKGSKGMGPTLHLHQTEPHVLKSGTHFWDCESVHIALADVHTSRIQMICYFCVTVPGGRLSWPPVSFVLHAGHLAS